MGWGLEAQDLDAPFPDEWPQEITEASVTSIDSPEKWEPMLF